MQLMSNTSDLAQLSAMQQLPYIDLYLADHIDGVSERESKAGKQMSLEHLYMAVLGGSATYGDKAVWAAKGSANYNRNPMDANNDGVITPAEPTDTIRGKWSKEFGTNLDERSSHIRFVIRDKQGYYLFDPSYNNGLPLNNDPTRQAGVGNGSNSAAPVALPQQPVAAPAPSPRSPMPTVTPQNSGAPVTTSEPEAGKPPSSLDRLLGLSVFTPTYSIDQINKVRDLIETQPAPTKANYYLELQEKVAYRNQRNNATMDSDGPAGDDMCNMTSLAMVLETVGIGKPKSSSEHKQRFKGAPSISDEKLSAMQYEDYIDLIRKYYKLSRYDNVHIGRLAEHFGADWKLLPAGYIEKSRWVAISKLHLAKGRGIIFSIHGHIVRLQGVANDGLIVDDPYGNVKLFSGSGANKYMWEAKNAKDSSRIYGSNQVWPWSEVEAHKMLWIASVGR